MTEYTGGAAVNDGQKIMDNLDEFERTERYELYAFGFKGRRIELVDPAELDWQDLANLRDETEFLKLSMSDEDLGFFLDQKVPVWRVKELMERYFKHYGIEDESKTSA